MKLHITSTDAHAWLCRIQNTEGADLEYITNVEIKRVRIDPQHDQLVAELTTIVDALDIVATWDGQHELGRIREARALLDTWEAQLLRAQEAPSHAE